MLPVEVSNLIEEFCNKRVPVLDRLEKELSLKMDFTMRCNAMLRIMQRSEPWTKFNNDRPLTWCNHHYGGPYKWESWSIREGLWKADRSEKEHWELFKDYFNHIVNEWSIDHPIFTETNMYTALSIL